MQNTTQNQASVSVKAIAGNKEQFTFSRTSGRIKANQVEALLSLLSGPLQKPYVMLKALALSTHNIFEQENNELEPEQKMALADLMFFLGDLWAAEHGAFEQPEFE